MCECNSQGLDMKTPRNVHLTAFYKRSFAHHTVKKRMPVILTQIIDSLVRNKEQIGQQYGEDGQQELKTVIGELSKLKYEVQTNKPFRKLVSVASDVHFYNNYIQTQSNKDECLSFYSAIWLFSECYMYRRIREAFELTNKLREYDPFLNQKQNALYSAVPIIINLAQYLTTVLEESREPNKNEFIKLLKLNIWGNKCDLSLSDGKVGENTTEIFDIEQMDSNILCDHSQKIWSALTNKSSNIVDIVLDNSGYELFTDFCLADYLISKNLASKIRFYVKSIPWFISDVMAHDFHWTLNQFKTSTNPSLKSLGDKWTNYVKDKVWNMCESNFWTLPVDYSYMAKTDSSLYKQLAEADLIIFKGDLNYRKLFGEKNWDPTTPIDEALQNFNPSKLCTLRTIKSDIVCGLPQGVVDKLEALDEKWMEKGDYGIIQFSDKVVSI